MLPTLGVVLLQTSVEIIVGKSFGVISMRHGHRLRMLSELCHVLGGMPPLKRGEVAGRPVLPLPEKVLAE